MMTVMCQTLTFFLNKMLGMSHKNLQNTNNFDKNNFTTMTGNKKMAEFMPFIISIMKNNNSLRENVVTDIVL